MDTTAESLGDLGRFWRGFLRSILVQDKGTATLMVPPSSKQSPAERVLRGTTCVVVIGRFKISPPPKMAVTRMVTGFSPPSVGAPAQKEVFYGRKNQSRACPV